MKVLAACRRVGSPTAMQSSTRCSTLITKHHPEDKVLVFTQFADTVDYLDAQLEGSPCIRSRRRHGRHGRPDERRPPLQPGQQREAQAGDAGQDELRVVLATDVLSEGQNLQDCADHRQLRSSLGHHSLDPACRPRGPHRAAVRHDPLLLVSAGRWRRADHQSPLPRAPAPEGERRSRRHRRGLLRRSRRRSGRSSISTTEKAGILDGDDDTEVDLASYAYQIWKNAIDENPELEKIIPAMPNVVYSTRSAQADSRPAGRGAGLPAHGRGQRRPGLGQHEGKSVTESQFTILKAAECAPGTPAVPRHEHHHEMVATGREADRRDGKIGRRPARPASGARFRTYERLKAYAEDVKGTLFADPELNKAIEDIYKYPLLQSATDTLNRQLKSGIADQALAELVISLRQDARLCR